MKKVKYLVVDSGAFIKNAPLHEYGENIFTVEKVLKEIKDKATLQRLQFLPYKLEIKNPFPENNKHVTEFSKKTGDYGSLSATDLQIIALTLQLEKEHVGVDHLNKEPSYSIATKFSGANKLPCGFYYPKEDNGHINSFDQDDNSSEIDSSKIEVDESLDILEESQETSDLAENIENSEENNTRDSIKEFKNSKENISNVNSEELEYSNEDDSEEESWISPDNIAKIKEKMGALSLEQESQITVACITTDFSVQNVLIQMGLSVLSIDGMLIKQTRIYILRCYACFKLTNNTSKQFCPNCGNKTLKRVSITVNDDGSKKVHINFRRPINIRGTRYSLPMPKGGKHDIGPVLCEDQPIPQNKPAKMALKKIDVMNPDYEALSSPFVLNDIYSRAANLGIRTIKHRNSRKNPNEWSKRTGNKKRK